MVNAFQRVRAVFGHAPQRRRGSLSPDSLAHVAKRRALQARQATPCVILHAHGAQSVRWKFAGRRYASGAQSSRMRTAGAG